MQETQLKVQGQGLHPVVQKILTKRGLNPQEINEFFSWDLLSLPDLTALLDIDKAATRLITAIDQKELIGIYGDYDVDGTTSCALLYRFFQMLGVRVELIQPSRFVEGYGIHPPSVDSAHEKGIKVLVTVDCGITNNEAADRAKEVGIDLIITDHHKDAREEMPTAFAIVNPSRRDEPQESPLKPMAGVGVAFALGLKIKQQLEEMGRKMPSLYPLLQYVAIGTICDLAKLTPLNLKLVRHGLKQLPKTQYAGLRAFLSLEDRAKEVTESEKLSFNIGPMINSKGRLEHPEAALNLIISDDSDQAFHYYSQLEICNKERKFIQAEVFKGAKEQVLKYIVDNPYLSICYHPEWHEGVIGIVASKLVENFKIPAVVFTDAEEKGIIKASARSAGDLNLFDCLHECRDLFIKFGGHKAAAGLSMPKENLAEFKKRMIAQLIDVPEILRTQQDYYDLEINPNEINLDLLKHLERLEPFGMGNAKPRFKMRGVKLASFDLLKEIHVRWNFESQGRPVKNLKGISFNYIGKWGHSHPQEIFENQSHNHNDLTVYFTLGINHFRGGQFIQLYVDKVTLGEF